MSRFSPEGSQTRPLAPVREAEPAPAVPAQTVLSLLLLLTGALAMAGGVAWWLHPGAGLAILGAAIYAIGFMIGNE